MWWGCYGSCLTNRARPLLFILFLRIFMSLWLFKMHFIPQILRITLRFLTLFLQSHLSLPYWSIQLYIYISLWTSPSALKKSIVVDWAQNTNLLILFFKHCEHVLWMWICFVLFCFLFFARFINWRYMTLSNATRIHPWSQIFWQQL